MLSRVVVFGLTAVAAVPTLVHQRELVQSLLADDDLTKQLVQELLRSKKNHAFANNATTYGVTEQGEHLDEWWEDLQLSFKWWTDKQIQQFEDFKDNMMAFKDLSVCVKDLPGGMSDPRALFKGAGKAFRNKELGKFVGDQILDPVMEDVGNQVEGGIANVKEYLQSLNTYMVTPSGQVNQTAVAGLANGAFALARKQLALNKPLDCLVSHGVIDKLERVLGPLFDKALDKILTKVLEVWNPAKEKIVSTLTEGVIGGALDKITATMKNVDEASSQAVKAMCTVRTQSILNAAEAAGASGEGGSGEVTALATPYAEKPDLCSETFAADFMEDPKEATEAFLKSFLQYQGGELVQLLMLHVITPLAAQINTALASAIAFLMQMVDGVMGLVPEVGAAVAASITAPLTATLNQAMTTLANGYVTDLAENKVQPWLVEMMNSVASDVTEFIIDKASDTGVFLQIEKLESQVEEVIEKVKAVQKEAGGYKAELTAFLAPVAKYIKLAIQKAVPKLKEEVEACDANVKAIKALGYRGFCQMAVAEGDKLLDKAIDMAGEGWEKIKESDKFIEVKNHVKSKLNAVEEKVKEYAETKIKDTINNDMERIGATFESVLETASPKVYALVESFGKINFHVDDVEIGGKVANNKITYKFSGEIGTDGPIAMDYSTTLGDSFTIDALGQGGATLKFTGTLGTMFGMGDMEKICVYFEVTDDTKVVPDFSFTSPKISIEVEAGALTGMINKVNNAMTTSMTSLFQKDGAFTTAIQQALEKAFNLAAKELIDSHQICLLGDEALAKVKQVTSPTTLALAS